MAAIQSGSARLSCAVLQGDRQSQEQQKKVPKRIMHELSLTPLEKGEGDRSSFLALPFPVQVWRPAGQGLCPMPLVVLSTTWLMTVPNLLPLRPTPRRR